jgi:hypothetical protein
MLVMEDEYIDISVAYVAGGREVEAWNPACPKTTHSEFRPPNTWFRPS